MSSVVRPPLVDHFVPLGPERHGRVSVPSGAHPPVLDKEVAQDLRPELVVDPYRARRSVSGAPASTSSHRRAPPTTNELADRTRTEVAVLRSGRFGGHRRDHLAHRTLTTLMEAATSVILRLTVETTSQYRVRLRGSFRLSGTTSGEREQRRGKAGGGEDVEAMDDVKSASTCDCSRCGP